MYAKHQLTTVDHHHGQASRTVVAGYPTIHGKTMRDKAEYYLANMSWVHESLIREPRGHSNMLGGILTEPVADGSAFGMLFLHANGLFDGCGDSTFCAAAAVIETGRVAVTEPVTRFSIDTVNGPLNVEADVQRGLVSEVRFENVPSYFVERLTARTASFGDVEVETAFGGNYFGFVDAGALGLAIDPAGQRAIIAAALELWDSIDETMLAMDPHNAQRSRIELFTFVERKEGNHYKVANVYKPGRMGRTPSGTGTSAHIALRHAKGELDAAKLFVQESVLGTEFRGKARVEATANGDVVIATIGTKSYLMGIHQFYIDPQDPYANGFLLAS
jgi:proline racemase